MSNMKVSKEVSAYMANLARKANAKRPKEFYQMMAEKSVQARKKKAKGDLSPGK